MNRDANAAMHGQLFAVFNLYINFLKNRLQQRFVDFTKDQLHIFPFFDYQKWPDFSQETFATCGDKEVAALLHHFKHMFSAEEIRLAKQEWLPFKYAACEKLKRFLAAPTNTHDRTLDCSSDISDDEEEHPTLPGPINHTAGTMTAPALCF